MWLIACHADGIYDPLPALRRYYLRDTFAVVASRYMDDCAGEMFAKLSPSGETLLRTVHKMGDLSAVTVCTGSNDAAFLGAICAPLTIVN